ncbi:PD-(D/E)XK nuclease family protein [Nitrosomonas sp. Nm166]|uniref:PD-(D/E)XK nuclease family protein n=1 Tax=Nitrosomonas sp. Nm166 TaxID=1881054 RepID=UPI0008E09005|nr:PD-(D/E)XK nuclease family protein [Nitrosomonas sp. Nm166]SFD95897.1 probable DNA repair protein [Nitrosomonas sp. Nm166]
MSDSSKFPQLPFDEILKRINAGAAVITSNRRLALALKEKFNHEQINHRMAAWYSADILPFTAFIERIYFDALYSKQALIFPLLLSAAQEQALWESIIQSSETGKVLLRIPQTAQSVREAWQLAHAWQLIRHLGDFYLNEDGKAFLNWADSYQQITTRNHQTDQARLCSLITEQYEFLNIKKPSCLICYGFDIFTPQQNAFLERLIATGCEVVVASSTANHQSLLNRVQRVEYIHSRDEIYQAAIWARSKIEADPAVRVGIVVPALANYRSALMRIFNTVMYPDIRFALPGAARPIAPFNISLGLTLTSYPMIDAAFAGLALLDQGMEFSRASHWLRSPFIAGGETELGQRALLDARIRRNAEPVITLERLLTLALQAGGQESCPILLQCLSALVKFRQTELPNLASHAVFAKIISEVLKITGFPGERGMNSSEYQTLEKWQALIADFAALDHVMAKTSYHEAISRLKQMANETLFQPETPEVPIQILGVLEAAGMVFDHIWMMGLSDEQWPLRARPNPFVSLELQRRAKMPLGSTLESSAYCQRLMDGWLSSAQEVIVSYPKYSDDRDGHELKPSPLIKSIPEAKPVFPDVISHRDLILQSCQLERIEDSQALPLDEETIRQGIKGGTSVIKDYAACPFRAWAKHQLQIESLNVPHTGLNSMERGSLAHQVLAQLWRQLKTKQALDAISEHDLENMLTSAVDSAILQMQQHKPVALSGRFAQIEQRRLVRLVYEWLSEEKKRGHFTVIATEEKCFIQIGDLVLNARLDRIDELENGQHVIIDYKTRKPSIQTMIGDRPDEPQLPLYLLITEAKQQAAGVAFASLKRGEMGFAAIMRDADLLPDVKAFSQLSGCKQFASWEDLITAWRQQLTHLAEGFCSGNAKVNPKDFPATCAYCDMQLLCRIHERTGEDSAEQEDENG